MNSWFRDLRYALRALVGSPWLSLAAVITVALGIGLNTTMFGIIERQFFRTPAGVRESRRVVRVYVSDGGAVEYVAAYPVYARLRENVRGFAELAAFTSEKIDLGRGSEARRVSAGLVTGSFFPLLQVQAAFGRFFAEDEDRQAAHVAVLSFEFWRTQFGRDPSIIGHGLVIGQGTYTVIGVTSPGFTGIDLEPVDVWLPMGTTAPERGFALDCAGCYWIKTVGRLRPNVTAVQVASEATAVLRRESSAQQAQHGPFVILGPIQEARGPKAPANARLSLWLGVVSLLVLLIACANVANLLLARGLQRQREMAIRLALGSGRARLLRQMLMEGLALSALGGAAALVVAFWVAPVLATYLLSDGGSPVQVGRVLAFAIASVLLAGVAASVVPAWQASAPNLTRALKGGAQETTFQQASARVVLLVTQVALTLVLLDGATLFTRSLKNVIAIPLGFDSNHLLSVTVGFEEAGYQKPDINSLYEQIQRRITRLHGVATASLATGSPFLRSLAIGLEAPGVDDSALQGSEGVPYFQAVSPEYFATLGTRILRGRAFGPDDVTGARRVAIVNETMARRFWPGENPLGKCLRIGDEPEVPCSDVIGVVEDVRRNAVVEPPTMQYYSPLAQVPTSFFRPVTAMLVRTVGPAREMVGAVRQEVHSVAPDLPYADVRPIEELFEPELRPMRVGSAVLSLFGLLALALAAVGLYGVLAYVVTQRTREIGIRVAIGATRGEVLWLVMRQNVLIAAMGVALGAGAALLGARAVASLLYGITPNDPAALGLAVGLLLVVSSLATYLSAQRAAVVDPVIALRHE